MFGLFLNTYDYDEWHDLLVVSSSEGNLRDHVAALGDYPLLEGEAQEKAKGDETYHYVIHEVDVL